MPRPVGWQQPADDSILPAMDNPQRNVRLTERDRRFVDEQIASGRHADASEVVREALRRYEADIAADQAHQETLRSLAEQGEADIARGATIKVRDSTHLRAILEEASREADELLAAEEGPCRAAE